MGNIVHEDRLDGVHPKLAAVLRAAAPHLPFDLLLANSTRTREECMVNWGKGRTIAQCAAWKIPALYAKPNVRQVTFLRNPFASKHVIQPDGKAHAVDLYKAPFDKDQPHDISVAIATAMKAAAKELGVKMVWGGDWKSTKDYPHFEL